MHLNLFNSNTEALSLLDWPLIINDICSLAHFDLTKIDLSAIPTKRSTESITEDIEQIKTYLKYYEDYSVFFNSKIRMLPNEKSKFDLLYDLKKGKFFEASELNFFAILVEGMISIGDYFNHLPHFYFDNIKKENISKVRRQFLNPTRDLIDLQGNISHQSHPLLKKKYEELQFIETDLRNLMGKIAKNEPFLSRLQMENFDIINERYVLSIKSDSYQSQLGSIVARSQSGMTLFVEPFETREKSSKRLHLISEIESIILKLTIDLSTTLHQFHLEFTDIIHFLKKLDHIHTKTTYSLKYQLSEPIISKKFEFQLKGLFHPLLKRPVRNNIEINFTSKGLIISGPNTGGKTVILKSIAIAQLLFNMGLFIPADAATIYPFDSVFYFSHDHQNLSEGLSSFASESKYYLQLLKELGPFNLVIIDEIFNSTSSEEASALAIAFLEEIHFRSKSKILISTHHQVLKTFMHANPQYISGHMGFDFESNLPTYRLLLGEPGSSLAFKIFDNLSNQFQMVTTISQKAQSLIDHKQITYEELLQDLSNKKIEIEKLLLHNRQINLELKNQKASMEGILFLEKEKTLSAFNHKLNDIYNQAERLLKDVKDEKIGSKKTLFTSIASINAELKSEMKNISQVSNENFSEKDPYNNLLPISIHELKVPTKLFSTHLKKQVNAIATNSKKSEIQIQHGAFTLWVKANTLRYLQGVKINNPITVNISRTIRGEIEIDCRGMRLDQFQKICDDAISEVYTGEIPFVTIIHGHGDGILKNWLRENLKKNHRELKWENVEGNDGCTKISN
jgi:DNA mismatch repair protein MutS2